MVINRRMQEIGRPRLKCAQAERAFLINRDDNYRHILAGAQHPQAFDEFRSIHLGHFEIGYDEFGRVVFHPCQGFGGVAKSFDRHAFFDGSCQFGKNVAVGNAVVNNDNGGHVIFQLLFSNNPWSWRLDIRVAFVLPLPQKVEYPDESGEMIAGRLCAMAIK